MDLERYRPQIEAALAYAGGTHAFEDIATGVAAGRMQAWPLPKSIIVTEVHDYPRGTALHFFLAGGDMVEIEAAYPMIENWGRGLGCTKVTMTGRAGWQRSFITKREGWSVSPLVSYTKDLTEGPQEK